MHIPIRCPSPTCRAVFQAPASLAGKGVRCPKCQLALRVPSPPATRAAAKPLPPSPGPVPLPVAIPVVPATRTRQRPLRLVAALAAIVCLASGGGFLWLGRGGHATDSRSEARHGERANSSNERTESSRPAAHPSTHPAPQPTHPETPVAELPLKLLEPLPPLPPVVNDPPGVDVPFFFAQLQPLDGLLANSRLFAEALGKEREFAGGLAMFNKEISPEGAQGFDRKRACGLYARITDDAKSWAVVVLLPVREEAGFRRLLRDLGFKEQGEVQGLLSLKLPKDPALPALPLPIPLPEQFYMRFAEGYAHLMLAGDPNLLMGNKLLPVQRLLSPRDDKLLSATLRIDRLPAVWREQVLAGLRSFPQQVPVGGNANFQKMAAQLTSYARGLIEDARNVSLDLELNARTRRIGIDLYLQGKPGSPLAESITALGSKPSLFRNLAYQDAALSILVNLRLPEEVRATWRAGVQEATQAVVQQAKDPEERRSIEAIFQTLATTVAAGELDLAAVLHSQGKDKPASCVGAVKVPNGKELDQLLRNQLEAPENAAFRPLFDLDAVELAGLKAHRINAHKAELFLPAMRQGFGDNPNYLGALRQLFGDHPMYLAARPNTVFWAAGPAAQPALGQAIRVQPAPSPLVLVSLNLWQLVPLLPVSPSDQKLVQEYLNEDQPGRFRLELSAGEALRLHVGLDLALLRFASQRLEFKARPQ